MLYVGMTRAIERLVIAGVEPDGPLAENSWHRRVERALLSLGAQPEDDEAWGEAIRYRGTVTAAVPKPRPPRIEIEARPAPEWARRPAPVRAARHGRWRRRPWPRTARRRRRPAPSNARRPGAGR